MTFTLYAVDHCAQSREISLNNTYFMTLNNLFSFCSGFMYNYHAYVLHYQRRSLFHFRTFAHSYAA